MALPHKTLSPPQENTFRAFKVRIYPTQKQTSDMGQWIRTAHRFRNAAVEFLNTRRKNRSAWMEKHPSLAKDKESIPEEYVGLDDQACSRWLTEKLEHARKTIATDWNIQASKRNVGQALLAQWDTFSLEQKQALPHAEWLMLPRTILDQVVRDLGKTLRKAFSDRKTFSQTKTIENSFRKNKRSSGRQAAGFPQFRKASYPGSIRLQVNESKSKSMASHWKAGELFIPGVGRLRFRDKRTLPNASPTLITLRRNAAGQWHASFVYDDGKSSTPKVFGKLPLDPATGLPTCQGGDAGFRTTMTLSDGKEHKRTRYMKHQKARLATLQRSTKRQKPGSRRWQKNMRKVGTLHVRVANQRHAGIREIARQIVTSTAIICLEDLHLKSMLEQSPFLAGSVYDTALGKLKQEIQHQSHNKGHLVLFADRFAATTQTCSDCGHRLRGKDKLSLSVKRWTCPVCQSTHERDKNASINIRMEALQKAINLFNQKESERDSGTRAKTSGNNVFPWSECHPDLQAFCARGGLKELLEMYVPNSYQLATKTRVRPNDTLVFRNGNGKPA